MLSYKTSLVGVLSKKWTSLKDYDNIYKVGYKRPECADYWDTEEHFGLMRLQGPAPTLIQLCEEIPKSILA